MSVPESTTEGTLVSIIANAQRINIYPRLDLEPASDDPYACVLDFTCLVR
jgi:hypothetical protein